MVCPKCGRDNEDGKMICVECGNELKTIHIHSHRTEGKAEEAFGIIFFLVIILPALFFSVKYFNFDLIISSIGMIIFELYVLLVVYEIIKCLIAGNRLNKAYVEGNVDEADKYVREYAAYKKIYQKSLIGAIACTVVSIGTNVLFAHQRFDIVSKLTIYAIPICVIFMIVGVVEMLRKS